MREAAELHLRDRLNVKVLDSLSGLRTILNALKSEITDAVLKEILPRVAELFYKANDEKSLYFIAIDKIAEEHAAPIFAPPFEGARVSITSNSVGPPTFIKKVGQKIYFQSKITVKVEATETRPEVGLLGSFPNISISTHSTNPSQPYAFPYPGQSTFSTTQETTRENPFLLKAATAPFSLGGPTGPTGPVPIKRIGVIPFSVSWSATYTTAGNLTKAAVVQITHTETEWEPA